MYKQFLWIMVISIVLFMTGCLYCCAVVASDADRREEEMLRKEEEKKLWGFRQDVCDHGICVGDCDKCNRNLPFQEVEPDESN